MPREIPVGKNHAAIVDDADYEWLSRWKWGPVHSPNTGVIYAGRTIYDASRKSKSGKEAFKKLLMHRLIMDAPKHLQVDHINFNTLDNRRENLRLCTRSQQNMHGRRIKNKTGFRGVTRWFHSGYELYQSRIKWEGRYVGLGYYHDPRDAARAYNDAALEYFGEFAVLNKL
jgi:hypothetical protein